MTRTRITYVTPWTHRPDEITTTHVTNPSTVCTGHLWSDGSCSSWECRNPARCTATGQKWLGDDDDSRTLDQITASVSIVG